MITRGGVAQNLITLYKAMGGGWQAGRARPILTTRRVRTMGERSNWKICSMLRPPASEGFAIAPADRFAMKNDTESTPPPPADPAPGSGTRKGAIVLATLIVTSLASTSSATG